MKGIYTKPYRYRFTKPPQALLKAKLDNIAIVPASMLPLKETIQQMLKNLPQGGVFLCHVTENVKQKRVLELVGEVFRKQGHAVINLSMEQLVSL